MTFKLDNLYVAYAPDFDVELMVPARPKRLTNLTDGTTSASHGQRSGEEISIPPLIDPSAAQSAAADFVPTAALKSTWMNTPASEPNCGKQLRDDEYHAVNVTSSGPWPSSPTWYTSGAGCSACYPKPQQKRNQMSEATSTLLSYGGKLTRTTGPSGTPRGQRLTVHSAHHVINALVETLGFRHSASVKDEFAVSKTA